jgi:hypothetical protein
MKEMETLTDTLIQPDKMNKKVSNILNKAKKKKKKKPLYLLFKSL